MELAIHRPAPLAHREIEDRLARAGRAAVALSGGVDSAVVAALAARALGPNAHAVTLQGPAIAAVEVERARTVARAIGIDHVVLPVDPLSVAEYASNPSNRCYFCRRTETREIRRWADGREVRQFLDGIHADDLQDDRPGLAAMNEAGFAHPLLDAGWGKRDVRAFARSIDLPNWDAPSEACLASRVPHGQALSLELLGRVERAETIVRSRGFRRVRVRTDGRSARVVVDAAEVAKLLQAPGAAEIISEIGRIGFAEVTLDAVGYRPRAGA